MRIDNDAYARKTIARARMMPALIGISVLAALGLAIIPLALRTGGLLHAELVMYMAVCLFVIVAMVVLFYVRGSQPVVWCIELLPDELIVSWTQRRVHYAYSQVLRFEYEGLNNPARADVAVAPFPPGTQRILVITLADGAEARVRVEHQQADELRDFAQRLPRP